MAITLPKEKVKATKLSPDVLIIYAPPKTGKTSSLTKLDDNLIIDLEKGTARYDAMAIQANSYQELQDVLIAMATEYQANGGKPLHKFGSIDTLDALEEIAIHKGAEMYGQVPTGKTWYTNNYSSPGVLRANGDVITNLPNGAGYYWVRVAMKYYIEVFKKFFEHLILISHVKDKRLASIDGTEEVVVKDISLTGRLGSIIAAMADGIGFMYQDPKQGLMISFKTSDGSTMGSRCTHLAGQKMAFDWSKIYID